MLFTCMFVNYVRTMKVFMLDKLYVPAEGGQMAIVQSLKMKISENRHYLIIHMRTIQNILGKSWKLTNWG